MSGFNGNANTPSWDVSPILPGGGRIDTRFPTDPSLEPRLPGGGPIDTRFPTDPSLEPGGPRVPGGGGGGIPGLGGMSAKDLVALAAAFFAMKGGGNGNNFAPNSGTNDPQLQELFKMMSGRMRKSEPLHDSILSMANGLLPTQYQSRGAPPTGAPPSGPPMPTRTDGGPQNPLPTRPPLPSRSGPDGGPVLY